MTWWCIIWPISWNAIFWLSIKTLPKCQKMSTPCLRCSTEPTGTQSGSRYLLTMISVGESNSGLWKSNWPQTRTLPTALSSILSQGSSTKPATSISIFLSLNLGRTLHVPTRKTPWERKNFTLGLTCSRKDLPSYSNFQSTKFSSGSSNSREFTRCSCNAWPTVWRFAKRSRSWPLQLRTFWEKKRKESAWL